MQVAAAALLDGQGRVLIAERPAGKHMAGYWEFPGGKLEPGETAVQALSRELAEELAVIPGHATPLLSLQHAYPERTVRLAVYSVQSWDGELQANEGQRLAWVPLHELSQWRLLPADKPIVKALQLPAEYWIGPEPVNMQRWLAQLEQALASGARLLQLRAKQLPSEALANLAELANRRCEAVAARLMINGDVALAQRNPTAGLHLSASQLLTLKERPVPAAQWLAASCHNRQELAAAEALDVDFVVLGPVLPTDSHPGQPNLGWGACAALLEDCNLPAYALGGVSPAALPEARAAGAIGVAGISAFWPR